MYIHTCLMYIHLHKTHTYIHTLTKQLPAALGLADKIAYYGGLLFFFGLYFGVLSRDCSEMCTVPPPPLPSPSPPSPHPSPRLSFLLSHRAFPTSTPPPFRIQFFLLGVKLALYFVYQSLMLRGSIIRDVTVCDMASRVCT